MKTLSNEIISIKIAEHGAELTSIIANGREYLWQADPKYWGRHSPILFPQVGRVWNNRYRHNGIEYEMGQHGFARDSVFQLSYEEDNAAVFSLESNEDTLKQYPFHFVLEAGYRLKDNRIEVIWSVQNTGEEEMFFQIGAHPAFYYRNLNPENDIRGFLKFEHQVTKPEYLVPAQKGCVSAERHVLNTDNGWMKLDTDTFGCDTYIFDRHQMQKITLADAERKPYLSLEFNSPLVAIWSPSAAHPDVPFVCIEPWYGRCDTVGYEGELKDREWIQHTAPGTSFQAGYSIIIEDV